MDTNTLHEKVIKWCEWMKVYSDKVTYYNKQLETATQEQVPHFTEKKEYYLKKLRFAETKYEHYSDLFVGDKWVQYMPQVDVRGFQ